MARLIPYLVTLPLLLLVGCGAETVRAAATRVLDTEPTALTNTPVCFLPPDPSLGLTERADASRVIASCTQAATQQKVRVVPFGTDKCLVATMQFTSTDTGSREAECSGASSIWNTYSSNCASVAITQKRIKLSLSSGPQGKVIAETTAAIRSDFNGFTEKSFFALCYAAFREYPLPIQGAQFEAPIEP